MWDSYAWVRIRNMQLLLCRRYPTWTWRRGFVFSWSLSSWRHMSFNIALYDMLDSTSEIWFYKCKCSNSSAYLFSTIRCLSFCMKDKIDSVSGFTHFHLSQQSISVISPSLRKRIKWEVVKEGAWPCWHWLQVLPVLGFRARFMQRVDLFWPIRSEAVGLDNVQPSSQGGMRQ